ncbi:PLP-dependent aminotransferase family protein [Paenibacillus sp. 7124]|uniref:PLP-dependent aminotransferase family protein n=1 Tax=Paenibacillus apii TaxID=1850370 RepID=A0A6M1PH13_9BACL|nr:PLP-dependent aminotransferase family protein [Paenibacillus apii]NGM82777.1 PLP-dependent aminotransferase family protein [Paenibacillus apii]NJJ39918.1 PLP-dependent aminotransferase family protein [Paenibacillus apii]
MNELSGNGRHPLFRQVYEYLAVRIDRGEWRAHDKLPSVRLLAEELRIHRLTVFKAYCRLKEDGRVYVKDKSGYYVAPGAASEEAPLLEASLKAEPASGCPSPAPALSDIQRMPVKYQFSQALIDPNLLPNLYLSDYVKEVFDRYPKVMGTYSSVEGDNELREFLSGHFRVSRMLQAEPEELLITSGAQQAINLIATIMLMPMDCVMVERPTYGAALDIFRQRGARLLSVDITPGGYDLDEIRRLMEQYRPRLFYINPTHHNPTGYTVPVWQRKRLVELAERYRCLIVEDDPFRDMYFAAEPPPPIFSYDTEGWVVYLGSFSKYVAPGLRICAVICRYPLMDKLIAAKFMADNGTPLLNQKIFLHYFTSPRLQGHLAKLRIALQVHKEIAERELAGTGCVWTPPEGGLNLWVRLPEHIPPETLFRKSKEQSIAFVPGEICDPHGVMKSWIRLSYSFAAEDVLREGMGKLSELMRSL